MKIDTAPGNGERLFQTAVAALQQINVGTHLSRRVTQTQGSDWKWNKIFSTPTQICATPPAHESAVDWYKPNRLCGIWTIRLTLTCRLATLSLVELTPHILTTKVHKNSTLTNTKTDLKSRRTLNHGVKSQTTMIFGDLPNPLLFDFSPSRLLMGAWAAQSPLPQLKEGGIVHRWRPDSHSRSGEGETGE